MTGITAPEVDPSNAAALEAWDGGDGDHWTENEAIFDASVARYHRPFLDAAAIAGTDHVLDIGCGTGQTTRDAARRAAAGSALGVDLSSRMIAQARRRAAEEGVDNARFEQADAQIHPFDPDRFDVAISRTGAMCFGDPVAAFTNIARALRPDGRLALLVWQSLEKNHWLLEFSGALAAGRAMPAPPPGAPGPLSLADPDRVRTILSAAGFAGIALEGMSELMWFGKDAEESNRFVSGLGFTRFMLSGLDDDGRARALDALRASIVAHETDHGVLYPSAAWVITARRR